MDNYQGTVTEAHEKYGDCKLIFYEYTHGIFSFAGLNEMKTLALCVVVDNIPYDFSVNRDDTFTLADLSFSELLVYNPDNELVERYTGC